jgi:hypothetical protein
MLESLFPMRHSVLSSMQEIMLEFRLRSVEAGVNADAGNV